MLCAFLLSGCGESMPRGYNGSESSDTLKPIAAPPGSDQSPPLPGTTGAAKTPDGLPALNAKGANTHLFSQKISDEADRLDRLENAVQELRNDFDAMAPAIVRLVAIEGDIQNLIKQLEVLTGNPSSMPSDITPIDSATLDEPSMPLPVPSAPPTPMDSERDGVAQPEISSTPAISTQSAPAQETIAPIGAVSPTTAPKATQPVATTGPPDATQAPLPAPATSAPPEAAPAKPGGAVVSAIRIGEHPGKIRIVLDLSSKTDFAVDLDSAEKILVVELPHAGWTAPATKTYGADQKLLSSYRTEGLGDDGSMLIFQLKANSSITYKGVMQDTGAASSRIVIDLTTP
ncbi:MAG: hypothetical protein DI551_01930 [Micavibrio aeruginosavorus]|uniref:AMIN domain-containing protein n=1 Tax=Micavibrio aeruginosavorus TaxID=349221 RepID=A0A2W5N426_9BACT|nr:MAG: hypothetical protein DI551_01930 [Micavibrio aeruginosavorus]